METGSNEKTFLQYEYEKIRKNVEKQAFNEEFLFNFYKSIKMNQDTTITSPEKTTVNKKLRNTDFLGNDLFPGDFVLISNYRNYVLGVVITEDEYSGVRCIVYDSNIEQYLSDISIQKKPSITRSLTNWNASSLIKVDIDNISDSMLDKYKKCLRVAVESKKLK